MSEYKKYRETHIRASKNYYLEHKEEIKERYREYAKNHREEKREYDKKRIRSIKKLKKALLDIKELLLNEEQPIQPSYIRYNILEIIEKLGDKENE